MTVEFRRATRDDLPALRDIEISSFPEPHWPAEDFLRFDTTVAVVEGHVVGMLVVREIFSGEGQARAEREILNVAVAGRFRRQGIGTRLLREELKSGARYFLEVRESNVRAQTLYARVGFTEVGRRKEYYENPAETAIVMQVK